MPNSSAQEPPSRPTAPEDCFFYHTTEVPGLGVMPGPMDLRLGADAYLGHVDMEGLRVLEIGTASGFLAFHMESRGAEVTACELASLDQWDIVPYEAADLRAYVESRLELGRRMRNGFWLTHAARQSKVQLRLFPAYDLPKDVGPVDVTTFCAVLLHLRDPFLALQSAAQHTTGAIVVTDLIPGAGLSAEAQALLRMRPAIGPLPSAAELSRIVGGELAEVPPRMDFAPRFEQGAPMDTWWQLNPAVIREFLGILGFEEQSVQYHYQLYDPKYKWADAVADGEPLHLPFFTVVGRR